MNKEELVNLNMKDVILNQWKSKLSYPLNHKDIEELENIIDYYEGQNQKYKEVIDKAINNSQYWIDYYTRLNSDERIALRLQENIDILKEEF